MSRDRTSLSRGFKGLLGVVFALVFALVFLLHFPVGLLKERLAATLPAPWVLDSLYGRVNDGCARLRLGDTPLHLRWQIDWFRVFSGRLPVRISADAGAVGHTEVKIRLKPSQLHVDSISFYWVNPLAHAGAFDESWAFLANTQQTLTVNELNAVVPWSQLWPTHLVGSASLTQVRLLGLALSHLSIVVEHADQISESGELKPLVVQLRADEVGWNMSGQLILMPDLGYRLNVELEAERAETRPDWAGFLMTPLSPTRSRYQASGNGLF